MRCLMCAAEMFVTQVVQDDTMPVPGFEHHTLECLECGNIERRLVFTREKTQPISPSYRCEKERIVQTKDTDGSVRKGAKARRSPCDPESSRQNSDSRDRKNQRNSHGVRPEVG